MASKTQSNSRRAFPRVPLVQRVEIERPERGAGGIIEATLADISQNGLLVVTNEDIPPGEWITIRPDHKGAGFGAEVVAIVERNLTPGQSQAKLACRFPQPVDYSVLRLFM
jgi:hypothetical protein